jgi:hypothetical protein
MIGAGVYSDQGCNLWQAGGGSSKKGTNDEVEYKSIMQKPNFDQWMKNYRFKEFCQFIPAIWRDSSRKTTDPWWEFAMCIEEFNERRQEILESSVWWLIDECMSAYCPRKTATGGLPNISYIERKPEPLGAEFKAAGCSVTGCLMALEIQRGKTEMAKQPKYELGATTACTLRLSQNLPVADDIKVGLKGDSWFGSVKTCAMLGAEGKMGVFQVKTAHALFPKKIIESTLSGMPGGVHIVLEGTHPNGQHLIALGYRYSTKKTLSFIFNAGAGSTRPGEPYEMKFPTEFSNVGVRLVDRPDVVSKYFAQSNCIDKHNHVRQSELALEKRWVTQDPYFRLHTTIFGMNVVDCWKLAAFHGLFDGLPSNQYRLKENAMPIKKFAGILAMQLILFSKSLSGSSTNNIPCTIMTYDNENAGSNNGSSDISSPTEITNTSGLSQYTDCNGFIHCPVAFNSSQNSSRRGIKPRRCSYCREEGKPNSGGWARHYCSHCNKAYCCPGPRNDGRNCFRLHVEEIRRHRKRRVGV